MCLHFSNLLSRIAHRMRPQNVGVYSPRNRAITQTPKIKAETRKRRIVSHAHSEEI